MKNIRLLGLALLAVFAFTSCDEENTGGENDGNYEIPSTYDFENVSYTGQIQRLDMLDELTVYMKTANDGAVLDAQTMLDMYANENSAFDNAELNAADSKELENKTVEGDIDLFKTFMNDFAQATIESNGAVGSNGTPGVVTSNDGANKYFFDANGVEHIQYIEKGLMGSCFYFQGVSIYLASGKNGRG